MKKLLLLSLLLCTSFVGFSQKGIGVRLGDPSGVSFKVYNGDKAFELSFGRSYLTRGKGIIVTTSSSGIRMLRFPIATINM
ncbi:MAG: hypothetical protein JKY18_13015 [Flavobacteriales bacterium]|nr:hypothetical protein [Flavobacteriales bacterium]